MLHPFCFIPLPCGRQNTKKERSRSHTAGVGREVCTSLARVTLGRACLQEDESCAQVSSRGGYLALGTRSWRPGLASPRSLLLTPPLGLALLRPEHLRAAPQERRPGPSRDRCAHACFLSFRELLAQISQFYSWLLCSYFEVRPFLALLTI